MSNERKRLAREWAESVNPKMPNEYVCAARDHILATTTPPPMDEVEWDTEKHVLAGATLLTNNDEQVDVVMLAKDVSLIEYATLGGEYGYEHYSYFTPNGKRYELVEVTDTPAQADEPEPSEPEHPETLSTLEDYENAPVGTIVVRGDYFPWAKANTNLWSRGVGTFVNRDMCAVGPHQVLRWGWGE